LFKYRKKPVVVEAFRLGVDERPEWIDDAITVGNVRVINENNMAITTLKGVMIADKGDWIIKEIKGELYPCKPDIFEQTYEKVKEQNANK